MKFRLSSIITSALLALLLNQTAAAADVGKLAPAVTVATLKNFEKPNINLDQLAGKVVYVDFWASWCGPCRRSFPVLDGLYKKYQNQGLVVVGINLDENPGDAERFLKKYPASFPLGQDPKGISASLFKVEGMPSGYLLDRQGVVQHIVVGFKDNEIDTIEPIIKQLLGK